MAVESAWELLEAAGASIAYSEEDDNRAKLYVYVASPIILDTFAWIEAYEQYKLPDINWNEQWQIHGMDFEDGLVHVNLEPFGASAITLDLEPGPGFGDLSHPTTLLVLKLMAIYLQKQSLVDIGCGSGILTLAGIAMGSPLACGIDIDNQALLHSEKNAQRNQMREKCHFTLPEQFELPKIQNEWLIVMNMIRTEQQEAWNALSSLHVLSGLILTSGLTVEERADYLMQTEAWGWQLNSEIEESGWLAFCFSLK